MKRIIAIMCACLLLTGCDTSYKDAETTSTATFGGYFTLIKTWGDVINTYDIVYANDTKVKYLIWNCGQKAAMTPLYNADGSLQVYEEEQGED